jgi:hypothetical protein
MGLVPPLGAFPLQARPRALPVAESLPTIVGKLAPGESLVASPGAWTGAPSSFSYQWQACAPSSGACSDVPGATGSSYKLAAGDIGHTMRVVVTAINEGGAASTASATTTVVVATPPTASFTVEPASAFVGQRVTFDGSSSTCPDAPCTYEWSDDGGTARPIPSRWSLGGGQLLQYTFSTVGTKYVRLVITDAVGLAATVEHNLVVASGSPPPPVPPKNVTAPSISGIARVGERLTAVSGTWSGSTPMSYSYQWQDCDASGESCSNLSGATSAIYTVVERDVGHTLRVLVTVANSAGSTPLASKHTSVVAPAPTEPTECTTTLTPATGVSAIANAIVVAHDGDTVCLAGGSYPPIHVIGAAHGAYVTVRPAAGATAIVDGMEVQNSSFLRFEGLKMTEGFNMRDGSTAASHDYQFIENTFEEPLYGIVLFGGSGPIKRVLIEGNYMHYVHLGKPEVAGKCEAGYAQGQDVTINYAEGVRIAHNTFNEAAWHYIQGGSAGPEGVDVEHNLFEGHILLACSHLNLWQIWAGGENDTFKDNIAIGRGRGEKNGLSEEAATDGVIFENGAGSVDCSTTMKNSVVENNLFVNAATSYELQIYTTEGATIKNNTVVGSQWGSALLTEHCGAGSNYTMTHNIDVEDQGSGPDMSFGACTGTCLFDNNVTEDTSASQAGSTHYVTNWSPVWTTTTWNPASEPTPSAGFYIPTGLSAEAGYQGGGGP